MCHFIHKFPCENALLGGVKWCNIVLKLLVSKRWNPLSCQPLHIDTYTHTVYGVLSCCCYTCVNHSLSSRKEALTTKRHPASRVTGKPNPTAHKAYLYMREHGVPLIATEVTIAQWRCGDRFENIPCRGNNRGSHNTPTPSKELESVCFKFTMQCQGLPALSFLAISFCTCSLSAGRCGLSSSQQWQ